MAGYHTEAVVEENGTLVLRDLPFPKGRTLEVIVVEWPASPPADAQPLLGTPVTYTDPFEPVALEDWSALG